MTDRDIIVSAFNKILDQLDDEDVADIARGMCTVTLGYHDAFTEIKRKVGGPGTFWTLVDLIDSYEPERFSVRADLLEPQPKDDGYHELMADVYDMREKAR